MRGVQIVLLCEDNQTDAFVTNQRRGQLENQCEKEGVPRRKREYPVVVMVPRRNIETWFAYLDGENVEEQERYPKLRRERDCERHAKELYRMCNERQELREPAPDSLREACVEYGGLKR